MTDFKAKMHQIRFPQTPLGELTALAQTPATPLPVQRCLCQTEPSEDGKQSVGKPYVCETWS